MDRTTRALFWAGLAVCALSLFPLWQGFGPAASWDTIDGQQRALGLAVLCIGLTFVVVAWGRTQQPT